MGYKMLYRIRARIGTRICICFLGLIIILSSWISYINVSDDNDFEQEFSPYDGPPIFFVTTRLRRSSISLRTACAIEAASFHHPNSEITLFSVPLVAKNNISDTLLTIPNVKIRQITEEEALKDTPLHKWFIDGQYKSSEIGKTHIRDAIRLALLFKHGGVYLHNDVWCLKTLNGLNSIELRNEDYVDDSLLIFEKWHKFIILTIKEFADNYQKYIKTSMRGLVTNVIKTRCNVTENEMLASVASEHFWQCLYIRILPVNTLNPIHEDNWQRLFEKNEKDLLDSVYVVRLWNSLSENVEVKPGSDVTLDYLARFNCPLIYGIMKRLDSV